MLLSWRERQAPGVPSTVQSQEYHADPGPGFQSQISSESYNFDMIPRGGQYMPSAGQSELVAPSFTPIVHSLCVTDGQNTSKDRFYPKGTLCMVFPSGNQTKRRFKKHSNAHYAGMFANGEKATDELMRMFNADTGNSISCFPISEGVIFPSNSSSEYIPLSVANHAEVRVDLLSEAVKTGLLVAHELLTITFHANNDMKIQAFVHFEDNVDPDIQRSILEYNNKVIFNH